VTPPNSVAANVFVLVATTATARNNEDKKHERIAVNAGTDETNNVNKQPSLPQPDTNNKKGKTTTPAMTMKGNSASGDSIA
jgi:hypothetical protein